MRDVSLKELLEAGCHFGHQVTRQNPRAREFIFQEREGVHIIDLAKTREGLLSAANFIREVSAGGGSILVVGTKRQAKTIVEEALKKMQTANQNGTSRVFFVTERWIGGTLTNFEEVAKNYRKLKDLGARLQSDEEKSKYTKKEVGHWEKDRQKLEKFYGGVSDLVKLPDCVFIVDTHKEDLAVKEAGLRAVPVVGIVDTNADPTLVEYPIPANDDAVGSLELIINYVADAWVEGQKEKGKREKAAEVKSEAPKQHGEVTKVAKQKKAEKVQPKKTVKPKKETADGKHKPRTTKKAA